TRSTATTAAGEAGSEHEAGTEAATGPEAAEARVTAVCANMVAEFAAGLAALFVQRAPIFGTESGAEAEAKAAALEGALGGCGWGVHVCVFLYDRKHGVRFRYVDDISETIAMQRLISDVAADVDGQVLTDGAY